MEDSIKDLTPESLAIKQLLNTKAHVKSLIEEVKTGFIQSHKIFTDKSEILNEIEIQKLEEIEQFLVSEEKNIYSQNHKLIQLKKNLKSLTEEQGYSPLNTYLHNAYNNDLLNALSKLKSQNYLRVKWTMDVENMDKFCVLETSTLKSYAMSEIPEWGVGSHGVKDDQLETPSAVATNPTTGDVYVCDYSKSKINVYSPFGFYKKTIKNLRFAYANSLNCDENYFYVTSDCFYTIHAFSHSGLHYKSFQLQDIPRAIAKGPDTRLYICYPSSMIISVHFTPILVMARKIVLKFDLNRGFFFQDMKITRDEIIILGCENYLVIFDRHGVILRYFMFENLERFVSFFCLDLNNNLILNDENNNLIRIYNLNGDCIYSFAKSDESHNPSCLTVDKFNRIIIVHYKRDNFIIEVF